MIYKEYGEFTPHVPLSTATVSRLQQDGAHCVRAEWTRFTLISLTVRNLWSHLYLGPNTENTSGGLLSYSALQNWFRLVPVEWQDQGITMRFYRRFKIKHYKTPWQPMLELTVCKYSWRLLLLEDYFIIWFSKKEKGGKQPQRARRIRWSWSM